VKWYHVTIIILSVIVIILITGICLSVYFGKQQITTLTKKIDSDLLKFKNYDKIINNNDASIDILNKQYNELKKQKQITIIEYKTLTDPQKEAAYQTLLTQNNSFDALVKSQTIKLVELEKELKDCNTDLNTAKDDLKKANDKLKIIWHPNIGLFLSESASIDTGLNAEFITSLNVDKYIWDHFYIGGGLNFDLRQDIMNDKTYYGSGVNIIIGGVF